MGGRGAKSSKGTQPYYQALCTLASYSQMSSDPAWGDLPWYMLVSRSWIRHFRETQKFDMDGGHLRLCRQMHTGKVYTVACGNHLNPVPKAEGRQRAAYSTAWVVKGNSDPVSVDSLCRPWPPLHSSCLEVGQWGRGCSLQKPVGSVVLFNFRLVQLFVHIITNWPRLAWSHKNFGCFSFSE